jgi:HD-GYP domain-containing protein (c-di-GMP phosphodiesterase class II)
MDSNNDILEALYKYTKGISIALSYRDLTTSLHSERVHDLSLMIGSHYGLSSREISILKISATFHDIGKLGIPDNILLKHSKLDEEEWEVMKRHSEIGEEILLSTGIEGSLHTAHVIRHHHEHYDGGGYPDGLSGDSIPICSSIISIADSYDAMAVTRPYHHARKHVEIMEIMCDESGKKFDPQLMNVFSEVIDHSSNRAE